MVALRLIRLLSRSVREIEDCVKLKMAKIENKVEFYQRKNIITNSVNSYIKNNKKYIYNKRESSLSQEEFVMFEKF